MIGTYITPDVVHNIMKPEKKNIGGPAPEAGSKGEKKMSEKIGMKKTIVYLPAKTYEKLTEMQKEAGISRSEILREIIRMWTE